MLSISIHTCFEDYASSQQMEAQASRRIICKILMSCFTITIFELSKFLVILFLPCNNNVIAPFLIQIGTSARNRDYNNNFEIINFKIFI